MHLLPCPSCESSIEVAPSQAGNQITCPSCGASVPIPKLGQLRQLPRAEQSDQVRDTGAAREAGGGGGSIAFGLLGLIATASLLIAGFCAVRWVLMEVPTDTESHIAELQAAYKDLKPAELIREYEQMEEFGLDMPMPYKYHTAQMERAVWGRNSLIAGGVFLISLAAAVMLGMTRPRTSGTTDT